MVFYIMLAFAVLSKIMSSSNDSNQLALIVERNKGGSIATIKLNEPPMNPLGDAQIRGLKQCIEELAADNAIRVIVIRGASNEDESNSKPIKSNFSVGANLKEQDLAAEAGPAIYVKHRIDLCTQIESCEKLVIAAIQGYCLGGGLELAMACHFRVAEGGAKLGLPEIDLGGAPMWSGASRVLRLVGRAQALELLLLGEKITASKALEVGLINQSYPADQFDQKVTALAETLAAKAPLAESEDLVEGVTALFEKRRPVFKGK